MAEEDIRSGLRRQQALPRRSTDAEAIGLGLQDAAPPALQLLPARPGQGRKPCADSASTFAAVNPSEVVAG